MGNILSKPKPKPEPKLIGAKERWRKVIEDVLKIVRAQNKILLMFKVVECFKIDHLKEIKKEIEIEKEESAFLSKSSDYLMRIMAAKSSSIKNMKFLKLWQIK